ncbi:Clampless protein 1 [Mycena sanguinolenta]|uniref:Clampless protein 1 n=1 Tax=Mycena sanguinolenta TaxID=230812 RepID=A0A8H6YX60_9AGAR|nr:Clampless protein 1 [Mycena sanguinolenta]
MDALKRSTFTSAPLVGPLSIRTRTRTTGRLPVPKTRRKIQHHIFHARSPALPSPTSRATPSPPSHLTSPLSRPTEFIRSRVLRSPSLQAGIRALAPSYLPSTLTRDRIPVTLSGTLRAGVLPSFPTHVLAISAPRPLKLPALPPPLPSSHSGLTLPVLPIAARVLDIALYAWIYAGRLDDSFCPPGVLPRVPPSASSHSSSPCAFGAPVPPHSLPPSSLHRRAILRHVFPSWRLKGREARDSYAGTNPAQLSRTLTQPAFTDISRDALAAAASEFFLATASSEFIRQGLLAKSSSMQVGNRVLAPSHLPSGVPRNRMPGTLSVPLRAVPQGVLPSYSTQSLRHLFTSHQVLVVPWPPSRGRRDSVPGTCSHPRRTPRQAPASASHPRLLTRGADPRSAATTLPSPSAFAILHAWMYTSRIDAAPCPFSRRLSPALSFPPLLAPPRSEPAAPRKVSARCNRSNPLHDPALWDALDLAWRWCLVRWGDVRREVASTSLSLCLGRRRGRCACSARRCC